MPTSHPNQINQIINLIITLSPQKILEIGPGFGAYGVLAREYLDIADGRENYKHWQRQIDCIEVFPEYLTPVHKFIYNHIFKGNALKILPKIKKRYDLILIIDVLEHLKKNDGQFLLKMSLKKARSVIVSTPIKMDEQNSAFGNPYEKHLYQWSKIDFEKFKPNFKVPNNESLIYFLGQDARMIKKKINLENLKNKAKKYFPVVYSSLQEWKDRIKKISPGGVEPPTSGSARLP